MKKAAKWIGIGIGSLLGLIIIAAGVLSLITSSRLNKVYAIEPEVVMIPADEAAVARGKGIVSVSCAGCHGDDLSGGTVFNEAALGWIESSNLTAGKGGVGGQYSDADWVRAIRHGVGPEGRPLLVMPSRAYYYFSDQDLGSIIAYLKSVPAVDNEMGGYDLKMTARAMAGVGAFGDILAVEMIDHDGPRPEAPAEAVDAAYGEYLVTTGDCSACHGAELAGGNDPNPDAPSGPNLTPGGNLGDWTAADFIQTIRNGSTPDGRVLDPEYMPWQSYRKLSDDQLTAIYLYLASLPAK